MRTLVIDTATRACSVALFENAQLLAGHYEVIGRGHAERLLPLISDLPETGKADQIMVDVGPGSFTGIRVGLAAAKALGLAWGVPVHGYGCLALVSAMARQHLDKPETIDVVMTGGHGEYFFEAFDASGASIAPAASIVPDRVPILATANCIAGDIAPVNADHRWIETLPDARQWMHLPEGNALPPIAIYGRAPDAKPALAHI
nr:tRNA (adenosine(37)-N6)-threonylcarbamoyltransferase complex dimerization subunit type 1 TsaB [uncultured Sphingorhabdus sp.]